MAHEDNKEPADEPHYFWEDEAFWRRAAFAVPTVLGLALLGGLVPTFFGAPEGLAARSEIFARFALIGVAIVTFTTVMWRGMIATRQANNQERQLENFNKQFAQSSEDILATLFKSGAEMLAEDKPAMQSAGIDTLHTVAAGKNERLATASMNVLADFIQDYGRASHENRIVQHAIYTLNTIAVQKGRLATRELTFTTNRTGTDSPNWIVVLGTNIANYEGGGITLQNVSGAPLDNHIKAKGTVFVNVKGISFTQTHFENCNFFKCDISIFRSMGYRKGNIFTECNFSNTAFPDGVISKIDGENNFFEINRPPIIIVNGDYARLANEPPWLNAVPAGHADDADEDRRRAVERAMARNTFGSYPRLSMGD